MAKGKYTRRHTRKMRGGYNPNIDPAATSASFTQSPNAEGANTWVESQYGNTNQQYNRVFDIGSKTLGNSFTVLPASQTPTPESVRLAQSAGARKKRAGMGMGLGKMAATASVPLGLLYLQNRFGKRKSRKNMSLKKKGGARRKSRKMKHHKKSHKKHGKSRKAKH